MQLKLSSHFLTSFIVTDRGHGGAVVTYSPPTTEVGGSNPEPYVGKMVVSYSWMAAHKTTRGDMTYTVLKAMLNLK